MTPRWFIGLRRCEGDWVTNLIKLDGERVYQFNTHSGCQDAPCTEFHYDPAGQMLRFRPGGQAEENEEKIPLTEVADAFGTFLTTPDKWEKLTHGMRIKSEVTLNWLQDRIQHNLVR